MRFQDLPIGRKLALLVLSATVFALVLACLGFALYERQSFQRDIAEELKTLAETLGANTAASLAFDDQKSARQTLAALAVEDHVLAACLYDLRGRVFASYRRGELGAAFPMPAPAPDGAYFAPNRVTLTQGVFLAGEKTGSIAIVSDLSAVRRRLLEYSKIALLVLIISIVVTYSISIRLLRIVNLPIVELAGLARRVSTEENYSLRAIAHSQDESGILVQAFNQMLERIEQSNRALKEAKDDLEQRVEQRTADLKKEVAVRIRAEELMRSARDAAEVANRAKSEFLANMSHEIRTPLNGVIGMNDLVLETDLNAEQREYLETVKVSADSLLGVINDILDYSKIEAGKVELESIDFNLHDCIEEALKTFALVAHGKGLELLCDVSPEVPELVAGDPGRLRQVLCNLVSNAIKFTAQGEVALKVTVAEKQRDGHLIAMTVSDTGIGIPPEKQKSIFSPFTQADTSTTRKYGGTGLGLTISSRLAAMMGGTIRVESQMGRGTQFHFTVRVKVPSFELDPELLALPETLRDLHVLVVDDNATNRRILQQSLIHWGAQPACSEGVDEALSALDASAKARNPFALVLTDVCMPGKDGFQLVEDMRRYPETRGIPVVMLTSAGNPEDARRRRELNIQAYLTKPVRKHGLLTEILRALGHSQKVPERTPGQMVAVSKGSEGLHILLAEDNRTNQLVATRLLEKMGHSLVVANNGEEALALLEHGQFDLVLMDIQMPGMDGLTATREIRERERATHQHIPIIAMTAHAMKGDRERCIEGGMDGYVSKPIKREQLEEAIAGTMAQL